MDRAANISIIVPVYNVELYLHDCLDSIFNQTFTDYELILVDDGSTDNSGAICDIYATVDSRTKVIHQSNQGQAAARNNGIKIAKGEWIHFVDSDDVIHPKMLEYLHTASIESEVKYSACQREEFDTQEEIIYKSYDLVYKSRLVDEHATHDLRKKYTSYWTPYASLIKKEIVISNMFQSGRIFEDNAVCFKWMHEAGRIALFEYPMYFYRDNPTGTMNQRFSVKRLDYLWALREQILYYDEIKYCSVLNTVFDDYIDSTIGMYYEIGKELQDSALQKEILCEALAFCRKYRNNLKHYDSYVDRLEKRIHPLWHKVKKHIGK